LERADALNVFQVARAYDLPEDINECPYHQGSKRESIRQFLNGIQHEFPDVYRSIFNGIFNIKKEYLP